MLGSLSAFVMFKNKNPVVVDNMGEPLQVGDWKRQSCLGSGGFGIVSLWINETSKETLAIKKCRWRLEDKLTARQKERWTSEVQMMKTIKNDNIVAYKAMPDILEKALSKRINNPSGVPILSMEYCRLGCLRDVLSKPENCCGLPEVDVINILNDTSNALRHLHGLKITHRDFKPENVVLQSCSSRKDGIIYKLIDLGYAKELGDSTVSFVGTFQYLAPEIFQKQKYDKRVDFWSFGITAFEIICGLRPFLHNYPPVESLKQVEKKSSETICIQYTHTGDIKESNELLKENHINMQLKENMEKWFRSVLQYDPEKRGLMDNIQIDVFDKLQEILSKKVVTVFSVYTYELYSYEVHESTLYSTLQAWIERDVKICKAEQMLIPSKMVESDYVLDYCEEDNSKPTFFVFKRNTYINESVRTNLPRLIRILFEEDSAQFNFGTYRQLHAQTVYFVLQETKHQKILIDAITCLHNYLKRKYDEENKLFNSTKSLLNNFLLRIEFFNLMESSVCMKMYNHARDDNKKKLKECLSKFEEYMHQVEVIAKDMNRVIVRQKKLFERSRFLNHVYDEVDETLKNMNFDSLYKGAIKHYDEVAKTNLYRDTAGPRKILIIASNTIKNQDTILRNDKLPLLLMTSSCKYSKELEKLKTGLRRMSDLIVEISESAIQNVFKRLKILQDKSFEVVDTPHTSQSIIDYNRNWRYRMQEFIDSNILNYKNTLDSDEKQGEEKIFNGFIISNGFAHRDSANPEQNELF